MVSPQSSDVVGMRCLFLARLRHGRVIRPCPLRRAKDTLEEICAAFRAAWEAARRSDPAPKIVPKLTHRPSRASFPVLCQF